MGITSGGSQRGAGSGRNNGSKGSVAWSMESGGTVCAVGTPEAPPPESPEVGRAGRERVVELEGLLAAAHATIGKERAAKERAERKCRLMQRLLSKHGIEMDSDDDGEEEGGRVTGRQSSPPMMRVTTSRIVGL